MEKHPSGKNPLHITREDMKKNQNDNLPASVRIVLIIVSSLLITYGTLGIYDGDGFHFYYNTGPVNPKNYFYFREDVHLYGPSAWFWSGTMFCAAAALLSVAAGLLKRTEKWLDQSKFFVIPAFLVPLFFIVSMVFVIIQNI